MNYLELRDEVKKYIKEHGVAKAIGDLGALVRRVIEEIEEEKKGGKK